MGTLSKEELEEFSNLPRIRVVFDIGARDNIDYLAIKPKATYHLFEPNPVFFEELRLKVGDRKNVILNNFGLGEKEGMANYNERLQAFGGSDGLPHGDDGPLYPIKTLDWYVDEHRIKRIDFLKIDAEGMDYQILLGGQKAVQMTRYLQYETWDKPHLFTEMLAGIFEIRDIGTRNMFCTRR